MRIRLSELDGIPSKKLASVGIFDSDQLLARASTPAQRKVLSRRLGIRTGDLEKWAGVCDLLRVKGVGPAYAQLLIDADVASVQGFISKMNISPGEMVSEQARIAERKKVLEAAKSLRAVLSEYAARTGYAGRLPTIQDLAEMAEEAVELKPRLVSVRVRSSSNFRDKVMGDARAKFRRRLKKDLDIPLLLGGLMGLVLLVFLVTAMVEHGRASGSGEAITALMGDFEYIVLSSMILSVSVYLLGAMAAAYLLLLSHSAMERIIGGAVTMFLFDSPGRREYYESTRNPELKKDRRIARWAFYFAVLGLVAWTIYFLAKDLTGSPMSMSEAVQSFRYFSLYAGVFVGAPNGYSLIVFYLKKKRMKNSDESFKRLLFLKFISVALVPLVILSVMWVFGPLNRVHSRFYLEQILPGLQSRIDAKRMEISLACDDADDACKAMQRDALERVDRVVSGLDARGRVTDDDLSELRMYIAVIVEALMWGALPVLILSFVLPYLVLGGIKTGIYYIVLLVVVFSAENLLQGYAPSWFGLARGSVPSMFVIAFFIFANALFFDWLYEILSEKKKRCPGCGIVLDEGATFCSSCGMLQP